METEKFDVWAMVELMGHQRIAGKCTERNVAGTNFLQVDVPQTKYQPGFSRLIGGAAIYAINPTTEEVAKAMAERLGVAPITPYDVRAHMQLLEAKATNGESHDIEEEEEEEEESGLN